MYSLNAQVALDKSICQVKMNPLTQFCVNTSDSLIKWVRRTKNVLKNMQYMWSWFKFSVLCLYTAHLCKQWVIWSFEYFMHTESVHIVHSILTIYSRNTLVGLWTQPESRSLWAVCEGYEHIIHTADSLTLKRCWGLHTCMLLQIRLTSESFSLSLSLWCVWIGNRSQSFGNNGCKLN